MIDYREANRIILAWGSRAPAVSAADVWKHRRGAEPPPGCRHPRQDGFACWGEVNPVFSDLCSKHDKHHLLDGLSAASEVARLCDKASKQEMGVYFVVGNGLVKIGKANHVPQRFAALRTHSPVPLRVHRVVRTWRHSDLEASLHRHFQSARRQGEWFEAIEVLPLIDQFSDGEVLERFLPAGIRPCIRGRGRDVARWAGTPWGREVMRVVPTYVDVEVAEEPEELAPDVPPVDRSPRENENSLQMDDSWRRRESNPRTNSPVLPLHVYIEGLPCPCCEIGAEYPLELVSLELATCAGGHRFKVSKYGELYPEQVAA